MTHRRAVVSEKGQITIPKPIRERLGIRPGNVLLFREEKGRLVATKAAQGDQVDAVYGTLGSSIPTDKMLRALRGGADLP